MSLTVPPEVAEGGTETWLIEALVSLCNCLTFVYAILHIDI